MLVLRSRSAGSLSQCWGTRAAPKFGLARESRQPWNCGYEGCLVQWETHSVRRDSYPASRDLSSASSACASSGRTGPAISNASHAGGDAVIPNRAWGQANAATRRGRQKENASATYHIQSLSHKSTMNCPLGCLLWRVRLDLCQHPIIAGLAACCLLQLTSLGDVMHHRHRRGAEHLSRLPVCAEVEKRRAPERIGIGCRLLAVAVAGRGGVLIGSGPRCRCRAFSGGGAFKTEIRHTIAQSGNGRSCRRREGSRSGRAGRRRRRGCGLEWDIVPLGQREREDGHRRDDGGPLLEILVGAWGQRGSGSSHAVVAVGF